MSIPNTGFIISLDNLTDLGDRTNWCSTRQWWTNVNIQLEGGVDATTAQVGDTVTVQVRLRGMLSTFEGDPQPVDSAEAVTAIQGWVCYPNTMPGRESGSLIVPSMVASPPTLTYPANNLLYVPPPLTSSPADDPGALTPWQSLGPVWRPGPEDLVPPNPTTHACIIANSQGIAFWDPENSTSTGPNENLPVGVAVGNDLSAINICTEPHQGQTNITIVPAPMGMIRQGGIHSFGFLAGLAASQERGRVVLDIVPVDQTTAIDPAVLQVLQTGPYANLNLQPATLPPSRATLRRNPHHCSGHLASLVHEAEEIIEDVIDDIERLLGHSDSHRAKGTRLRLALPPSGVQPLLFEAELDPASGPGAVSVFDLVQTTEGTGDHGGIRIALVVVP